MSTTNTMPIVVAVCGVMQADLITLRSQYPPAWKQASMRIGSSSITQHKYVAARPATSAGKETQASTYEGSRRSGKAQMLLCGLRARLMGGVGSVAPSASASAVGSAVRVPGQQRLIGHQ